VLSRGSSGDTEDYSFYRSTGSWYHQPHDDNPHTNNEKSNAENEKVATVGPVDDHQITPMSEASFAEPNIKATRRRVANIPKDRPKMRLSSSLFLISSFASLGFCEQ
jgi:hypothetical protein